MNTRLHSQYENRAVQAFLCTTSGMYDFHISDMGCLDAPELSPVGSTYYIGHDFDEENTYVATANVINTRFGNF